MNGDVMVGYKKMYSILRGSNDSELTSRKMTAIYPGIKESTLTKLYWNYEGRIGNHVPLSIWKSNTPLRKRE